MRGVFSAFALALVACGPTQQAAPDGGAGGAGGSAPSAGGAAGSAPRQPDAPACGQQRFELQPGTAPDVVLVFDKSGSMSIALGTSTRWLVMTAAARAVVRATEQKINWGLMLFPANEGCAVFDVDVPIGPDHAAMIERKVGSANPNGETPAREAIQKAHAYLKGLGRTAPRYILLATDGAPNCAVGCTCPFGFSPCEGNKCRRTDGAGGMGADACEMPCTERGVDMAGAIDATRKAAEESTTVIVVGMQTGVAEDAALTAMANVGGFARPAGSPRSYYLAENGAELEQALMDIAGLIVSCTYPLSMQAPDPDNIVITVNGMQVPRDETNGFALGPDGKSIVFHGRTCDQLQTLQSPNIQVVLGCPPPGKPVRAW